MKRLPAHAGIGEDLIGYLGGDDHRRLTAGHASHQTDENDQKLIRIILLLL